MKQKMEYETPEIDTVEIECGGELICGSPAPGGSEDIEYVEW